MSVALVPERMRISAERYQKMIATGVLGKYDRVELVEGDILETPPIGWPHSAVTAHLTKLFVLGAGDAAVVSPGGSMVLGDFSQPQPDLMLLKFRKDFYSGQFPTASDVLLIVEISDCSLAFDQSTKRALYARYGAGEYWVVDVRGHRLHVYWEPTANGYAQALELSGSDTASPRALPIVEIPVGTLFT
jgi:Uma2 family endonuclease